MSHELEHLADILERAGIQRRGVLPDAESTPVCPRCQGAGYLRYDVPVDDPRFGELIICECTKQELNDRRQRMLLERSQLADLQGYVFDTWTLKIRGGNPPRQSPDFAYQVARQYASELSYNGLPWLFLYGEKGTGKTHLAAAVGNARIGQGQPAIFMVVPDLLDHLRAAFRPTSEIDYDDLFESLRNTPLLILDDLGTQSATPWAQEKLYQLINHRYNRRLATVITMNEDADGIDPRLWSRINDSHLTWRCDVRGEDKRTHLPPPQNARPRRKIREEYSI